MQCEHILPQQLLQQTGQETPEHNTPLQSLYALVLILLPAMPIYALLHEITLHSTRNAIFAFAIVSNDRQMQPLMEHKQTPVAHWHTPQLAC